MGSAAAYHLAARGQRVLGPGEVHPGPRPGSSHGGSRIIRQSYFEDPAYVPLLLRAYELWEELARDSGREVYRLTGGLFIGPPDCLTVAGSLRAAAQWDLPHEMLDAAEIRRRFPTFTPTRGDVALYEAKAGLRAARADGAGPPRPRREARAPRCTSVRRCCSGARRPAGVTVHDRTRHLHRRAAGDLPRGVGAAAARRVRHPDHHRASGDVLARPGRRARPVRGSPDLHRRECRRACRSTASRPSTARRGGVKVGVLPQGRRCAPRRPSTAPCTRRKSTRCATRSPSCCPPCAGPCLHAATCMYSNTPDEHFVIARHPTATPTSPWRAASPGTASSSSPWSARSLPTSRPTGTTAHPIGLFDPQTTRDHMTTIDEPRLRPPTPPRPAAPSCPRSRAATTRTRDLRGRAGTHLRDDVVLRGAQRRSRRPRRIPDGPGRPRERARGPRQGRRAAARSSTSAATAERCCAPRIRAR